jgi:hypothetical protein
MASEIKHNFIYVRGAETAAAVARREREIKKRERERVN